MNDIDSFAVINARLREGLALVNVWCEEQQVDSDATLWQPDELLEECADMLREPDETLHKDIQSKEKLLNTDAQGALDIAGHDTLLESEGSY